MQDFVCMTIPSYKNYIAGLNLSRTPHCEPRPTCTVGL